MTPVAVPSRGRRSCADLRVNVRICAAIGLAALVAVAVGLLGLRGPSEARWSTQQIYRSNLAGGEVIDDVRAAVDKTRLDVVNHAISQDDATMDRYARAIDTDVEDFDTALQAYVGSKPSGDPAVIDGLRTDWQAYVRIVRTKLIPIDERNDIAGWRRIRDTQLAPLVSRMAAAIDALSAAEVAEAARSAAAARSSHERNRTMSFVSLLVGLLVALGLGLVVARGFVRSLLNGRQRVWRSRRHGPATHNDGPDQP